MTSRPVRTLAAVSLPMTALLSVISVLTQPEFTSDPVARLHAIDTAGTSATVSVMTFVLSQLPFVVGFVALAVLAHARAPRASWTGGVLSVLGGFGHAVFGGLALGYLALAADAGHRVTLAAVVTRVESGPAQLFMALGLVGSVLGIVFLGVALFRSQLVARWIPVAMWAFVVLEFGLGGVAAWAPLASSLVYLVALTGIAVALVRDEHPLETAAAGHRAPAPLAGA